MALSRVKTWVAEALLFVDLNNEFNNILDNALSLISPLTGTLDFNSNQTSNLAQATANGQAVRYNDWTKAHSDAGRHRKKDYSISGLTLSNNGTDATNDIDIAAGQCLDLTAGDDEVMVLASALTKRLDAAWAVGTGNGGLDTGAIANTTYHVWLIKRSDTGVVDALFSTSATAPTMPTNYDVKRRIGSIVRESAALVLFDQAGDLFLRNSRTVLNTANPGTSIVTFAPDVASGVRVGALISFGVQDGSPAASTHALVFHDGQNDTAPSSSTYDLRAVNAAGAAVAEAVQLQRLTDTSKQLRYRLDNSDAGVTTDVTTIGWTDRRGQDGSATN